MPDSGQARAMWDAYEMFPNIRDHSEVVALLALTLWEWLDRAGVKLNRQAVEVGALLHDISKTACIKSGKLHAQEGDALLTKLGYPELGYLVANHVYLPPHHALDETAVVNYADKRVNHDCVVSLRDRFQYIEERYGQGQPQRIERIKQGYGWARQTEERLFEVLGNGHRPEDLAKLPGLKPCGPPPNI